MDQANHVHSRGKQFEIESTRVHANIPLTYPSYRKQCMRTNFLLRFSIMAIPFSSSFFFLSSTYTSFNSSCLPVSSINPPNQVGQMDARHATKGHPQPGMLVVKIGGPAYRIGLGGGAASSRVNDAASAALDFNAVQVTLCFLQPYSWLCQQPFPKRVCAYVSVCVPLPPPPPPFTHSSITFNHSIAFPSAATRKWRTA